MWRSHRPSCIERTIRGSGDRASLGARSAIAPNFDPENETALPLKGGLCDIGLSV